VIVPAGIDEREPFAQFLCQTVRVGAMDRQPAAFFRAVCGKGCDDGVAAGLKGPAEPRDIGFAIGLLDQEMQGGTIMPDVESPRGLPLRHVLDDPLRRAGAPAEPKRGEIECGR